MDRISAHTDVAAAGIHRRLELSSGGLTARAARAAQHRVEVLHLGVAHTRGDALAWLPAKRIPFTGEVCVNAFLEALIAQVEKRMADASPEEAKAQIEPVRAT